MIFSKEERRQEVIRWQNRLVKSCTICKGVGSIEIKGTNKATMCSCQEQSMLNAHLVSSGVPRKYLDNRVWNWENLNNSIESTEKIKKYAENFKENYIYGKGLYIYGRQGRGKSLLESLVARNVVAQINPDNKKHFEVAFMIFEDMVQLSHQGRNDIASRQLLNMLIENSDLLIIDNIGSETGGAEYNTKLLELVLRKRDNNCVPTIISSNYTPEQLLTAYSDTVHDFITQNNELVYVEGDNFRKKGSVGVDVDFIGDADLLLEEDGFNNE